MRVKSPYHLMDFDDLVDELREIIYSEDISTGEYAIDILEEISKRHYMLAQAYDRAVA